MSDARDVSTDGSGNYADGGVVGGNGDQPAATPVVVNCGMHQGDCGDCGGCHAPAAAREVQAGAVGRDPVTAGLWRICVELEPGDDWMKALR